MLKKLSATKIAVLAVLFFTAVGVYYVWRDLHLDALNKIPLPDVVVENLDLERVINGDKWLFKSPRVEHKDGMLYGDSMDVVITSPKGRLTHITAEKGIFTRADNDLTLKNANGEMSENNKKYYLKSGSVFYSDAQKNWHFSDGIELTMGNMKVSGKDGYYDTKSGDCRVTNGGTIVWNE